MPTGIGMRAKDLRLFCMTARKYDIYLLVRQSNDASLKYVGRPGYWPKPAAIKAKTADLDPPALSNRAGGGPGSVRHQVAGLVAHPWLQPDAFSGARLEKARACWLETLDLALEAGSNIPAADGQKRDTWAYWGKEHFSSKTGWRWKIDIDPAGLHFGCLQIAGDGVPWSYVHSDYDLKDVIVRGKETLNERLEGRLQGVRNYTPLLPGLEFETIQRELNDAMGVPMVQHGAEAQFAWHGDEPITIALPDGPQLQYLVLGNAEAVQSWYIALNRGLIAERGKDYLGDRSRWFWFGNHGNLFLPDRRYRA